MEVILHALPSKSVSIPNLHALTPSGSADFEITRSHFVSRRSALPGLVFGGDPSSLVIRHTPIRYDIGNPSRFLPFHFQKSHPSTNQTCFLFSESVVGRTCTQFHTVVGAYGHERCINQGRDAVACHWRDHWHQRSH